MPTDQYGLSTRTIYCAADVQIGGSVWSDVMPTFSTVSAYLDGARLFPGPNQIFPNAIITFYPRTTTSSDTFCSGTGGRYCVFCSIDGSDSGFRGTSASEFALTTAGFSDSGDSVFYDDSSTKRMEGMYKDVAKTISFKTPSVSSYPTVIYTWNAGMDLSAFGDAVDPFATWAAVTYAAGSSYGSVMSVSDGAAGAAGAAGATDDGTVDLDLSLVHLALRPCLWVTTAASSRGTAGVPRFFLLPFLGRGRDIHMILHTYAKKTDRGAVAAAVVCRPDSVARGGAHSIL
jgi:hypothetical protein